MLGDEKCCTFNIIFALFFTLLTLILTSAFIRKEDGHCTGSFSLKTQIFTLKNAFKNSRILTLLLVSTFFMGTTLAFVETFWQPQFTSLLPSPNLLWLLGVLGFLYFSVSAIGSFTGERLLNHHVGATAAYLTARIGMGTCLILLSLSDEAGSFGMLYLLLYFLLGISTTAESVMINRAALPCFCLERW